jgi:hypothetical protein
MTMNGTHGVEDDRGALHSARIFDKLVESNIALVQTMRQGMKVGVAVLLVFITIAIGGTLVILRSNQAETRTLVDAIATKCTKEK